MNTPKRMTPSEITALGKKKRVERERMRAALDARKAAPSDDWVFTNEALDEALCIGPCVKAIFK